MAAANLASMSRRDMPADSAAKRRAVMMPWTRSVTPGVGVCAGAGDGWDRSRPHRRGLARWPGGGDARRGRPGRAWPEGLGRGTLRSPERRRALGQGWTQRPGVAGASRSPDAGGSGPQPEPGRGHLRWGGGHLRGGHLPGCRRGRSLLGRRRPGHGPDGAGVAAFVATFEDPALRDGAFFAGAVPSDPDATGITGLTVRAGAAASASTWAESSGVLRRLARSPARAAPAASALWRLAVAISDPSWSTQRPGRPVGSSRR